MRTLRKTGVDPASLDKAVVDLKARNVYEALDCFLYGGVDTVGEENIARLTAALDACDYDFLIAHALKGGLYHEPVRVFLRRIGLLENDSEEEK